MKCHTKSKPQADHSPRVLTDGTMLSRRQLAEALTDEGLPITAATLATMATRGGGPPFQYWGPRVIYQWGPGLAWAKGRLSPSRYTTSEHMTGDAA
jgi:hypothetical protein